MASEGLCLVTRHMAKPAKLPPDRAVSVRGDETIGGTPAHAADVRVDRILRTI